MVMDVDALRLAGRRLLGKSSQPFAGCGSHPQRPKSRGQEASSIKRGQSSPSDSRRIMPQA